MANWYEVMANLFYQSVKDLNNRRGFNHLKNIKADLHDLFVGLQSDSHDLHLQRAPDLVQEEPSMLGLAHRQTPGETERWVDLGVGEVRLQLLQEQGDGFWRENGEVCQASTQSLKNEDLGSNLCKHTRKKNAFQNYPLRE